MGISSPSSYCTVRSTCISCWNSSGDTFSISGMLDSAWYSCWLSLLSGLLWTLSDDDGVEGFSEGAPMPASMSAPTDLR